LRAIAAEIETNLETLKNKGSRHLTFRECDLGSIVRVALIEGLL
jgi:hypothetical protein